MHHNFRCSKYLPLRFFHFCLHFIYSEGAPHLLPLGSWQLPSVYIIKEHRHCVKNETLYNVVTLRMRMKLFLGECLCSLIVWTLRSSQLLSVTNRWGTCWLYIKCKQKWSGRHIKHRKFWGKINHLSSCILIQNLLTSITMILEVSNKHHCKQVKIPKKFCFDQYLWFSVVFQYCASVCSATILIHK